MRPPVSWIGLYELASAQRQCIAAVSAELALHVPRVTVEPSWPVAAAAVVTLCRVVAVRGDAGRVVVEVDAGTSSTVGSRTDRAAMLLGRLSPAQDRRVDIVAAACSTRSDTIQTLLPADIKVGDLIALPSVGDAAFAMTTSAVHVAVAAGRSWPLLESGPTRHGLLRRRVG